MALHLFSSAGTCGSIEEISINYLTRKVEIGTGTIADDKLKVTGRTLPKQPLLLIDEIGDGLAFEPLPAE